MTRRICNVAVIRPDSIEIFFFLVGIWDGFKNSAPKMYSFFVYQVKEGTGSDGSEPGESSSEDESGSVNGADEDGRKKFTPLVWSATGLFLLDQEPTVGGGVAGAHGRPRS